MRHSGSGAGSVVGQKDKDNSVPVVIASDQDPIHVIVDSGGGGGGSGTEYTEDAASASNPVGPITMARRRDSLTGETSTDGDNIALNATNKGELYVKHTDSVDVTGSTVSVSSLPSGLATSAKQDTGNASLSSIDGKVLTDTQLRATPVPVSGPLTDTELRATAVPVSGPLTDTQIRATPLPVSGTVTANAGTNLNTSALALEAGGNLAAIAASLSVIDDWDESDRSKVNPIVGQAGVQGGSGAVNALTQRVVLATDVALPAGTNAIGKLAANSGVDIGDVDVTSLPSLPAGTNNIGDVDVLTLPSIPAGTNNIGDVDVMSVTPGTGATDLGKAEDAAHTSGDVGVMALGVRQDTPAAFGADNDYTPFSVDLLNRVHVSPISAAKITSPTLTNVSGSATSTTLLASNSARRQVILVNDSSAICYVKFGTTASTTSYTIQMPAIANGIAAHVIIEGSDLYTGRIDAIWASATGAMRITEITA